MRKILTVEETEAKSVRNRRIMSGFLLFILLASTLGYAFFANPSSSSTTDNNGLQNLGNGWGMSYEGKTLYFTNSPDSINKSQVSTYLTIDNFRNTPVYIASESEAVYNELAYNIGQFAQKIQRVCYGNCSLDLPEKDCSERIIVWNQSQTEKVYQKENCIFIDGSLISTDAFLYRLFGKTAS